jgi:protein gp37
VTSSIEWTDLTWNPLRGCEKISAGCKHCYAETIAKRFCKPGLPYFGIATEKGWTGNIGFIPSKLAAPFRIKLGRRIFVNSMSDVFHERVKREDIATLFGVMSVLPRHTFQLLTKRPFVAVTWYDWIASAAHELGCQRALIAQEHAHEYLSDSFPLIAENGSYLSVPWPLSNLHLGVSVENQDVLDCRFLELMLCPAHVRWLSCEPLLGPLDLTDKLGQWSACDCDSNYPVDEDGCCLMCGEDSIQYGVDWVVVGCESGPHRRPCNADWVRSIVDQCRKANVPCFVKQLDLGESVSNKPHEWPEDLRVRMFPGEKWATP